ncbi:MAG: hypothetical protein U9P14_09580, partial [Gemmatimonadota bacterium]|nr:hypothetical protein [Gemmatimonadota bacterium]
MLFLILIVVFMAASIIGWTLFLRFQRERKLSEFKINYLRLSSEEENAYHHYLESEKRLQASEMDCERIKEIVSRIKQSIAARKAELRELIGDLRAIKIKQDLKDSESATLDAELAITKLTSKIRTRLVLNNEEKK